MRPWATLAGPFQLGETGLSLARHPPTLIAGDPLATDPESQRKMPNRILVIWPYSNWQQNGIPPD
jgi:hypothetical protein